MLSVHSPRQRYDRFVTASKRRPIASSTRAATRCSPGRARRRPARPRSRRTAPPPGRRGLRGVPPAVMGTGEGVSDLGDAAGRVDVRDDVADHLAVELDREGGPVAQRDLVTIALRRERLDGLLDRVGQVPELVARVLRVVAVRRVDRRVGRLASSADGVERCRSRGPRHHGTDSTRPRFGEYRYARCYGLGGLGGVAEVEADLRLLAALWRGAGLRRLRRSRRAPRSPPEASRRASGTRRPRPHR